MYKINCQYLVYKTISDPIAKLYFAAYPECDPPKPFFLFALHRNLIYSIICTDVLYTASFIQSRYQARLFFVQDDFYILVRLFYVQDQFG